MPFHPFRERAVDFFVHEMAGQVAHAVHFVDFNVERVGIADFQVKIIAAFTYGDNDLALLVGVPVIARI
jgi:hypothetical protein